MSVLTDRFPVQISLGGSGGPQFATDVVIVESGNEFRNANRQYPLRRYDVSHAARLEPLARMLIAFFHVAMGRLNTFPFKDWADYTALFGEGGFIPLDAGGYQMAKQYKVGMGTHNRIITRPLIDTLDILGNTGGTIDPATGILTGGAGVPTGWSGEFDILARFDTDQMEIITLDKTHQGELIYEWSNIPIVEVLS